MHELLYKVTNFRGHFDLPKEIPNFRGGILGSRTDLGIMGRIIRKKLIGILNFIVSIVGKLSHKFV